MDGGNMEHSIISGILYKFCVRKGRKKLSRELSSSNQIILSQILRFLDGKYHCDRLEQPHTSCSGTRPVRLPLRVWIFGKLEEYLQNELQGGCDLSPEFC